MQRLVSFRWMVVAVAATLLSGCASSMSSGAANGAHPFSGADYSGRGPGSLVEATVMTDIDRGVPLGTTSLRVIYRSTSGIDGSQTQVSGAVFIPPGRPPKGGWPVVAFAHGTTGLNPECGPSLSPNLSGGVPYIAPFLKVGVAVAAADYQGLGLPGAAHPYLDAKTAGFNVIDSVRALHAVSREVSPTWAGFGGSQGGAAMWSANEQAAQYAPELHLVGTVSMVPAADQSGMAAAAAAQTMNNDQMAMYIGILRGLERTRPDFRIDDYRHGVTRDKWDVVTACIGTNTEERVTLLRNLNPSELVPATPEAQQRLFELLTAMALPQRPASAPMLIVYAGRDEYVAPESTRAAIERACALGDQIQTQFEPDKGHGDVDFRQYVEWLGERFAGDPAPSNC
jgi:secretory lipase